MKKRVIAITQRLAIQENYQERREILACEWGEFFNKFNILPLPLSYAIPIEQYAQIIHGVILSGGNDLSIFSKDVNSLIRDEYERSVIEFCFSNAMPLLGVCRGAQMIAHYFNSSLCKIGGHVGEHNIIWNNRDEERVNSFHHYQILRLGDDLESQAIGKDRGIEAFSHKRLPIFGMMWHPEREKKNTKSTLRVFENFLEKIR